MCTRRVCLTAALAVAGWFAAAGVAAAHDGLVASFPADGQSLAASPERVELEFSGEIASLGGDQSVAVVTDPDGDVVSTGVTELDGPYVRQPLIGDLPNVEYQVAYRVVSSDGHVVSGTTRFFVGPVPAGTIPSAPEPDGGLAGPVVVAAGILAAAAAAVLVVRRSRHEDHPS